MMPFIELSTVYMPFFCLAFLLTTIASLYCVTASVVYRAPISRIFLCTMLLLVCLIPTIALTDGCYALYNSQFPSQEIIWLMRIPAVPLLIGAFLLLFADVRTFLQLNQWRKEHISRMSIKESVDLLPMGLCFCYGDNNPRLINLRMDALSRMLTGGTLNNPDGFWRALTSGALKHDCTQIYAGESPIIKTPDGTVWTFEQKWIKMEGDTIRQITATNTTEEYHLSEQLEKENYRLGEMKKRLCRYDDTVRETTREKEILNAKVRIHDELGQALIASRRVLVSHVPHDEQESVDALWQRCISVLSKDYMPEKATDEYTQLTNAAQAIGISVQWNGEKPREGTNAARILRYMAHECLTNAVRHADGTELYVSTHQKSGQWTFVCTNNGDIPKAPISEGGGLSGLRCRVEQAGGTMQVIHTPRFKLTIMVPEECEAEIWKNSK